jgi:integrase
VDLAKRIALTMHLLVQNVHTVSWQPPTTILQKRLILPSASTKTTTATTTKLRKGVIWEPGPSFPHSAALQADLTKFDAALTTIVGNNRTEKWLRTVRRFLPYASVSSEQRLPLLLKYRTIHNWKWSTTATYHGAILAALKILQMPKDFFDREATRHLEKQVLQEVVEYPKALSQAHARTVLQYALEEPRGQVKNILVAMVLAFTFGQRMSDILQLDRNDIDRSPIDNDIVITIRRGKVIHFCKPYTLHVPANGVLGSLLSEWMQPATETLFGANAHRIISETLQTMDEDYEHRSVRRGGLQALALTGMSLEDLRVNYSKHSTVPMLLRYLGHGNCLLSQAALHHSTTTLLLG